MKTPLLIRCALLLLAATASAQTAPATTAPTIALLHPDQIDEYLAIVQTPEPKGPAPQVTNYKRVAAEVLVDKFWSDPRAEKALAATATPPFMSGEFETPHMFLRDALALLRARKQYAEWMKDAPTAEKRLVRAREILAIPRKDNPTGDDYFDAPRARNYLIVETLTESGAAAVDIAVENPWHMQIGVQGYAEKFAGELADEAKRRGMKFVLGVDQLLWRMPYDKDGKWVATLQAWLAEAKGEEELKLITGRFCVGPDGRKRAVELLNDPRPAVMLEAAQNLLSYYADAESAKALQAAIDAQRKLGIEAKTLAALEATLDRLKMEGHLKTREELEAELTNADAQIMVRVRALRELAPRWPDQRTLDLLKKTYAEIPEAGRGIKDETTGELTGGNWLARYLRTAIPHVEKQIAAATTQPK